MYDLILDHSFESDNFVHITAQFVYSFFNIPLV